MKKVIAWLKESNRLKHIAGGIIVGLGADDDYCAAYAGVGVSAALELKDKLWGGKWDWIDFTLTLAGVIVGRVTRIAICGK